MGKGCMLDVGGGGWERCGCGWEAGGRRAAGEKRGGAGRPARTGARR